MKRNMMVLVTVTVTLTPHNSRVTIDLHLKTHYMTLKKSHFDHTVTMKLLNSNVLKMTNETQHDDPYNE